MAIYNRFTCEILPFTLSQFQSQYGCSSIVALMVESNALDGGGGDSGGQAQVGSNRKPLPLTCTAISFDNMNLAHKSNKQPWFSDET